MNCNETHVLIDADADGELDLVRHLELADHLRTCPECARFAENARARRSALRESLPRFTAPSELADKIRATLQTGNSTAKNVVPPAPRRGLMSWPIWNITGLAASLAFTLIVGFAWGNARARANLLI